MGGRGAEQVKLKKFGIKEKKIHLCRRIPSGVRL